MFRTLERFPEQVHWRPLKTGREDEILGAGGRPSGLRVEPVPVPGKPPIHLVEGRRPPDPEDGIGLRFRETRTGRVLAYFSGAAAVTPAVEAALEDADAVFFDGTFFWSSDELIGLGVGDQRAEQMVTSLSAAPREAWRRYATSGRGIASTFTLNNTNPVLCDDSAERAALTAAGWDVAWDGDDARAPMSPPRAPGRPA